MRITVRARAALLSLTALVGACTVGPDYRKPDSAALNIPTNYSQGFSRQAEDAALAQWWTQFGDPALDALVEQAVAHNLDVAQARARLIQAREAARQSNAAFLPNVTASGNGGRTVRNPGDDTNSISVGADASWEIDLFGGLRRASQAARAESAAAGYDLASVRVSIIAETVANYIEARLAQEQVRIARETLATQDDTLQIVRWRVMAGLASSLDEEQARTQRAQTAATIPSLEQGQRNALNRIAVLTGQAPGEATRSLEKVAPIPAAPQDIATGIPADVLRQRPDVRSAERTLAAQTARIGVAQSALLPSLRLTGNIGTSALGFGSLGDAITGGLFASIGQLIFDGGASASRVRAQRAATEGAFANYRATILTALEDVENGLVAIDATRRRAGSQAEALDAAGNSALLARSQYRAGLIDFQTLLNTERSLLSSRTSEAAGRADRAQAVVQLYRALGGGWQTMNESKP